MITISKKLKGIIPYKIVLWPTESALREMAENLPATCVARVETANTELAGRCVVGHHLSLTLAIDLQRDLQQIDKDLITNARIRIHKAQKLGDRVTVRRYTGLADQENLIDEFVQLYNNFVAGRTAFLFPVSNALIASYFPNAEIVLMDLDGESICGHMNLIDKESGVSRMEWSASRRFEDHAMARLAGILNVYLHWYEIEKYREEGFRTYDFGGIGGLDDNVGVNRFKLQFGGTIVREHNYMMAGMPKLWRAGLNAFLAVSARGRRRKQLEQAGDRWRQMPLELIRQTIATSVQNFEESAVVRKSANDQKFDDNLPEMARSTD